MSTAVEIYGFPSNTSDERGKSTGSFVPFHLNSFRGISPLEAGLILLDQTEKTDAKPTEEVQMITGQAEVISIASLHRVAEYIGHGEAA